MKNSHRIYLSACFVLLVMLTGSFSGVSAYPVSFIDADQRHITIPSRPERVVSLVPSVTELVFAVDAGDAVQGVTHHDDYPPAACGKTIVGGFFAPSVDRIRALAPDILFVSDLHQNVVRAFAETPSCRIIRFRLDAPADLFDAIKTLGRMFDRPGPARKLIADIREDLDHTRRKLDGIPAAQRKRVMRLMGRDAVMTPGDDSFQNALVRLAGGVPPTLDKPGKVVPVTLEEWKAFNPEAVYGCGGDRTLADTLLNQPGWRDVDAVKNGRIFFFPCDLTCRLSRRTGRFVSCLAARIYADAFAGLPPVRKNEITDARTIPLELSYVDTAEIVESAVNDYVHKTLMLHFSAPMAVSSTLEGFRENIRHAGNSYSPPQVWGLYHRIGLEASRDQLLKTLGLERDDVSMLFTGADMDNLSIQRREFRDMAVYALVTAGARTNAVRMAEDAGAFYEPGTINMIILSNMKLTPRAMNRAIISATEAKTAALWDMDVRSSYTPLTNPATGTGTDNIIVVQGDGPRIDNAGGHSKMGELIAKAVYAGVQEALYKQNSLTRKRNIFRRLEERRISLFGLASKCPCGADAGETARRLERLLLDPAYAGFMEAALAVSDLHERGLVSDISGFAAWCDRISEKIAGKPLDEQRRFTFSQTLPPVLARAFGALLNGMYPDPTARNNRP